MLQSVSHYAKGQGANSLDCFIARLAVRHHSRQVDNLRKPSTVVFALHLKRVDVLALTVT